MAVPKQRHTKSRRNRRRSHIHLERKTLAPCSRCGFSIMPHYVCDNCGYYKGREVFDITAKLTKRNKKAKEKELAKQEAEHRESAQAPTEPLDPGKLSMK